MFIKIYDQRYAADYRECLNGSGIARQKALDHFVTQIMRVPLVSSILDYGAGSGLDVGFWEKIFPKAKLYFCDVSSVAMEKFKTKYPWYAERYRLIRDSKANFSNDTFDLIVSIEVMEHAEQLVAYIQDIYRLLKPGGYFLWTTPCANAFSIEHLYVAMRGRIEVTKEGYRRWKDEDPTHLRRLKSHEVASMLRENGFSDIIFRFRAHLFSFLGTYVLRRGLENFRNRIMNWDYSLFRCLPNGASMIGAARKINRL